MEMSRHAATYEAGGEGAMLGAAAGELLVAGTRGAYGFGMQQAVLVAYHLMRRDGLDPQILTSELLEFAFPDDGRENVYRWPDSWFSAFLEASRYGTPAPMPFQSPSVLVRVVPVGVWFRKDPVGLVEAAIDVVKLTHTLPEAAAAGAVVAGAVAAAGFGQGGRDLMLGAVEVAARAAGPTGYGELAEVVAEALPLVGIPQRQAAETIASWGVPAVVQTAVAAVLFASPRFERPDVLLREAAGTSLHMAALTPLVGAIVAARSGLHSWPWPIPNDLWFAEIGRRLARRNHVTEDLPDPYAVEEVLGYELETGTLIERP